MFNLAEEVKETITNCTQIKSHETCQSSIVNGYECIWRQGACYNATNDGSGETIVADDQNDRNKIEEENKNVSTDKDNVELLTDVNGNFKFCEEDGVLKTFQIVGYMLILIKVIIPLLLIIFGSIDFGKAIIANDDKAIKGAARMLVTRAIGGVIIFFIPTIIFFATSLIARWPGIESEF